MTGFCWECKFFSKFTELKLGSIVLGKISTCHRFPPTVIQHKSTRSGSRTAWPQVTEEDHCGEFSPREGKES